MAAIAGQIPHCVFNHLCPEVHLRCAILLDDLDGARLGLSSRAPSTDMHFTPTLRVMGGMTSIAQFLVFRDYVWDVAGRVELLDTLPILEQVHPVEGATFGEGRRAGTPSRREHARNDASIPQLSRRISPSCARFRISGEAGTS